MFAMYETDLIIPDPGYGTSWWQSPAGIGVEIAAAFVVGILVGLWLGRRSRRREL
ncbi:MAG: hypothetical protein ACJ8C4_06450 [Gemmataceae bacterium]